MPSWQQVVVAATAVVRRQRDGSPVGTAVLVEGGRLLTCRHVVAAHGSLAEPVWISFPGRPAVRASPAGEAATVDAVVLRPEPESEPLPEPVTLSGRARPPAEVQLIGYPGADRTLEGVWRSFTVAGPTARGLVQLAWTDNAGSWPGHSGGPVVDSRTGRLVGLLQEGSEPGRFDRYLPLPLLLRHGVLDRLPWLVEGSQAETHFASRARGHSDTADLFRGRTAALTRVSDWLTSPEPPGRVLVVTGPPGAGKSAVVARSALVLRDRVAGQASGPRWSGLLFHARAARADTFRAALADLVDGDDSTVDALMGDVDRIGESDPGQRWVIVVDALDEAAGSEDRQAIAQLLTTLARRPWIRAVVATRALSPSGPYAQASLLSRFGVHGPAAGNLVDLDGDAYFEISDLRDLVGDLLAQRGQKYPGPGAWQHYRDDEPLRAALAAVVADRAARNYLIAGLNAAGLGQRDEVVDPRAAGFTPAGIPSSVGDALEEFLNRSLRDRPGADRQRLRGAYVALAYGAGAGITDAVWRLFADALGYPVGQAELDELRASAFADYLLQTTTEPGGTVTRLFHQALTDHLLAGRDQRHDQGVLLDATLRQVREQGGWARADAYALAHAADHAWAAGRLPELLTEHDYLLGADGAALMATVGRLRSSPAEAAVVLRAGPAAHALPPSPRAGLFAVSAAHLGLDDLGRRFLHRTAELMRPLWAHSLGTPHITLTGHDGPVRALAAIPLADGHALFASGSFDHSVRLWDATSGRPVGEPLLGHTSFVFAVAAVPLPGGPTLVASAGGDGTVRLWDPATGQPVGDPLTGHTGAVRAVDAVPVADGRTLIVSGGADQTVRLWDPATGQPVGDPLAGHRDEVQAVCALRSAGGRALLIASGSGDGMIRRWDAGGRPVGGPLIGHVGEVSSLTSVPPALIVSGSGDGTVLSWNLLTGRATGRLSTGDGGKVVAVAAVPLADDKTLVAFGGDDHLVRLWDPLTGSRVGQPLTGHTAEVWALAAVRLPEGRTVIASGGPDRTVRLWDPATEQPVGRPLTGHSAQVIAMDSVPLADGRTLIASAGDDAAVRLWDPATGQPVGEPLIRTGEAIWALAVVHLPDGRTLIAAGGRDRLVRLWDASTGEPAGRSFGHGGEVRALAPVRLAGGRTLIASGSFDRSVALWELTTGRRHGRLLTGHTGSVFAVAAVRLTDGRTLVASAGGDHTVRLWDPVDSLPVGDPLTGHTDNVRAVTGIRAADGRTLVASGGRDGTVRLWDPETGRPAGEPLLGHAGEVAVLGTVRMGDGRTLLVSGSDDHTVRLWDPVSRRPAGEPFTLLEGVSALTAVPGGIAVATGRAVVMLMIEGSVPEPS
ncbi:trypsin-like peptidase domain-containing protein [Actinoplanes sp. NPDC051343]|uniref:trypsin-like peptidase domain-containing protein n=1 Tax=Actinoplanes sp. NPDC051343 TaxID=3363906 RepID=UPI003796DD50